jgi:uncharacterized protein (TIGR00730 family)
VAAVCVYCSSSVEIDQRYVELARAVGAELAERGHALVSGGGSVSCMGAVAHAVRAGGGHTIGVIPQVLVDLEVADHEADELVVVGDMRARKHQMDVRSDAFLALPGGLGTLEELLEIWVARVLALHAKPVVVLDPDGVYGPLREQVDRLVAAGFVRPEGRDAIAWSRTPQEARDIVEAELAAGRKPRIAAPVAAPLATEVLEADP